MKDVVIFSQSVSSALRQVVTITGGHLTDALGGSAEDTANGLPNLSIMSEEADSLLMSGGMIHGSGGETATPDKGNTEGWDDGTSGGWGSLLSSGVERVEASADIYGMGWIASGSAYEWDLVAIEVMNAASMLPSAPHLTRPHSRSGRVLDGSESRSERSRCHPPHRLGRARAAS